jgi:hypothetical protein
VLCIRKQQNGDDDPAQDEAQSGATNGITNISRKGRVRATLDGHQDTDSRTNRDSDGVRGFAPTAFSHG